MLKLTRLKLFFFSIPALFFCSLLSAQSYGNYAEMTKRIRNLENTYGSNVNVQSLTKTLGDYDIWALSLSTGKAEEKPAIAIVAGIDGSHVFGTELALGIAETLLKDHSELLKSSTFYIFPNMSPNASEQYFSGLKYAKKGNSRSTDDDRDGDFDEDPFEDLNGDGLITMIRVEDPTGNYTVLKEDPRIMALADKKKGELGTHKVYTEGMDNDKDGLYNEDGSGGVHFNKNLSYKFPYFTPGAGEHPVSEVEHRALLDFLYDQWNIYAVVSLGPDNNLSAPLKYNKASASKRVVTGILKDDAVLNAFLSNHYNKITKTTDAPTTTTNGGGFFEWSYFHFGKLALSTPGWWVPKFKGDSINKASKNTQINFLKWAEKEGLEEYFVPWKSIEHPDFPNKIVEVGGISPFVQTNPPYKFVKDISKKHTEFLVELAKMQPNLVFENILVESVNNELTRVTVTIHNKGFIPTHTEMGKRSRWLRRIKLNIDLQKNQELISGKETQLINSIDGDSALEVSWLIKGKGNVNLEVEAPHTGSDKATINLK